MSGGRSSSGGVGFLGLLAIAFIVLKLTGYITWSWWWVLAPLWAPIGILLALLAFIWVMALATGEVSLRDKR